MIVTKVHEYLHLAVVCYLNSTGERNTDPNLRLQRVKDVSCTHDGPASIAYPIQTYPHFILLRRFFSLVFLVFKDGLLPGTAEEKLALTQRSTIIYNLASLLKCESVLVSLHH